MECIRCGNKDPSYFYKGSKGYYCRKCIGFVRTLVQEDLQPLEYDIETNAYNYEFNYELTPKQRRASKQCLEGLKHNDVLLHCVCGARQNRNFC